MGAPYLRRVELTGSPHDAHPFDIPAVASLSMVELAPVTVFVGDNGSGKSTLLEAIAVAVGFNAEGGGRNLRFSTRDTHSDLHEHLRLEYRRRPPHGWFLRAETFYGMSSQLGDLDPPPRGRPMPDLHARSHGEAFLTLIDERFGSPGLYLMDEPESALSFHGQLRLMVAMSDAVSAGSQFLIATHSPLLMRFPAARVLSFDDGVICERAYDDLEVVALWRRFMDAPDVFLNALLP